RRHFWYGSHYLSDRIGG
ncbi:bacterial Cytochrome Ubiquinol Oxidase family protein, partial [Vibrio cholerae HC-65A1]